MPGVNPEETAAGGVAGSGELEVFRRQRSFAPSLRSEGVAQRIARLDKLARALRARRGEVARALMADFRKSPEEVELSEIFPVLQEISHARRHLKRWMKAKRVGTPRSLFGTRSEVRREPRGVCLIVSPWNYPFNLTFSPLVSALAAGNTAILKPSELAPNSSAVIASIVRDLYPPELVAVFEGDADVATRLLALPCDHIFFTGSPAVGRIVMRAAAEHLSSVTLELGGKSPAIVDESADLDRTARNLVWSKFANAGQTCIAPDLVYVHERVHDEFLDKLAARIQAVYGRDDAAQRANRDYCRIIDDRHYERIRGLLDDARAHAARVVAGGESDAGERYIAPTVLSELSSDSRVLREEIFGPLMPVLRFGDLDTVLRDINGRPPPLALYVFGQDDMRTERLLTGIPAGGSCVNHSLVHFLHPGLPFGGIRDSGIGNSHGEYGFRAFTHERALVVDRHSFTQLMFPPYSGRRKALVRLASRLLGR